jgi:phage protein D
VDVETLEQKHSDYFAPTFVVKIGGQDLVRDLHLTVASVSVDLKEKAAGRFSITVTNAFSWEEREFVAGSAEERVQLLDLFKFGTEVAVNLGYGEPARLAPVMTGTITELATSFGAGGAPQLELSGYDKLFGLTIGKLTDYLEDKPDSDYVKRIAKRHNLTPDVTATTPAKPRIEQNEETDMAFLEKLAERNDNFTFYVTGDTLYFGPRHQDEAAEIVLPWGGGLTSFSPEVNLANQIAAVEVVGTSAEDGEQVVGRAEQGQESGRDSGDESGPERLADALSAQPVLRVRAGVHTLDEANAKAAAILRERAQKFLTGSAECIGLPELRPDMNVAFEGLGQGFSKTYWISGATHEVSGSGYTTSLTVEEPSI